MSRRPPSPKINSLRSSRTLGNAPTPETRPGPSRPSRHTTHHQPSPATPRMSTRRTSTHVDPPRSARTRSVLVSASPEKPRPATTEARSTSTMQGGPKSYGRTGRPDGSSRASALLTPKLGASSSSTNHGGGHSRRSSRTIPSSLLRPSTRTQDVTFPRPAVSALNARRQRSESSDILALKPPPPPQPKITVSSPRKSTRIADEPSTPKKAGTHPSKTETQKQVAPVDSPKGKQKMEDRGNFSGPQAGPERRVLPARIRRSAGRGAEGIRDLEDMICDWIERFGEPSKTPPDDLPIYITSLPLDLVKPPTTQSSSTKPPPPAVTLTPTRSQFPPSPAIPVPSKDVGVQEKIETPSWTMVSRGGDDEDEAREELGGGLLSPTKRLRHAELAEDTSDAYYQALHRKYEAFERRQKAREKETLVFERYKMRSRVEQLRNLSPHAWASVVINVASRYGLEAAVKPRKKLADEGPEWLRAQLVKEGKEVLKRYDQLLPPDPRKSKPGSTPTPNLTPRPSLSPAPMIPDRVAVLRDSSRPSKRQSLEVPKLARRGSQQRRVSEPPVKSSKRSRIDSPNGYHRSSRSKRGLMVPKIAGLEEEVWVVSHPKRAPAVSREEAMEMKEVEAEWL